MTKMVEKNRILVVVSVLEGKRFPRRPKHKLIAEAKFDGELLSTDPVDHAESPDFTQELAWELDKKGLQQHKLQRTSIKIQCYAIDIQTTMKEAIGYVVLDLRSAQNKQASKYYPLLQSKYHKTKPEIKLSLYLDEDKSEKTDGEVQPAKIGNSPKTAVDLKQLKPVLNDAEGFYQLGPESTCKDHFLLSVTIANATNLMQLIPSASTLPTTADGYFFYYSFFGNDVTNEPFHDLINPNFPAERASVRIRSKVDVLRMFFTKQPGIQVHLCCGDQSLGSCEVSLSSLLKKDSTEIYMKPVSVEGLFELTPPNKPKQQNLSQPGNLSPAVGLSVVLRKEDMSIRTPVKEKPSGLLREKTPSPNRSPHSKSPKQQLPQPKIQPKPEQDGNYSDTFEESEETDKDVQKHKNTRTPEKAQKATVSEPSHSNQGVSSSSSTTQHHLSIPAQAHHFTFSIDLRSIKDVQSTHPLNVFLRYTYQFFGSAAPIVTHPPVEIKKGMEVLLPQSFCAFDFACTVQQLQDTFLRVPLLVEVWNRDRQLSKDILLGSAKLPLEQMATVERIRAVSNDGRNGWRQAYSDKVPVSSTDGKKNKCGEVTVVLSLEDWGPLNSQEITNPQPTQPGRSISPTMPFLGEMIPEEPRQTAEYQTALEIELWKEQQEQAFENQLKQKEVLYMKALAEEWKKRDKERELLMKKKLAEYAQLEEQLRKTLADLEKKQKQQVANEQEVARLRNDLQREHDQKLQEMKEASRRMKEDCDHQINLQKSKTKELEELLQRYKQETADAEKKYKNLEREFASYKDQLHSKPEVRLQSEINLLTLEKVEVERKLDAATKSKIHYKQQWGRALKELARLKQREQEVAKVQLKRQQQELEHMRLRYLAAEEKEVVQSEKKELEDIKNELNKLKQLSEEDKNKQESYDKHTNHTKHLDDLKGPKSGLDSNIEEHITRLIEERDTLLRTGVYSTQDRIIAELDKQIRECIAQKKNV